MSDLPPFLTPSANLSFGNGTFDKAGRKVAAGRGVEWLKQGWELFKRSPGMWIAIIIVMAAASMLLSVIPVIGPLALNFVLPIFLGAIMFGCQYLARDGVLSIDTLITGFKQNTGNLALLGVFYLAGTFIIGVVAGSIVFFAVGGAALAGAGGASGASLAVMAGGGLLIAMLVVLALMVPLIMAFYFAPALVVLRDVAPFNAMKASFMACLKNIVPFLVFGLAAFVPFLVFFMIALVLPIIAMILLFVCMLVLGPVFMAANYASYMDIFE